MLKRLLIVLMVTFSGFVFSEQARASVSGTTWDIEGTMRVRVSIWGLGSQSETIDFSDEFNFHSDESFEMIDWQGAWKQVKNKFTVNLDPVDVETYFEQYLGNNGLNVTVEITKLSLTGTELKNGTINGKITMNMDFHLSDLDMNGKLSVAATFKGMITTGDLVSRNEENALQLRERSLKGIVEERLYEAINAASASAR